MFIYTGILKAYEYYNNLSNFIKNLIDEPAIILIYHRVTNLNFDPQQLAVKPENFYDQINHLSKYYNLIEIEEFFDLIKKGKGFPQKTVILTFDDGYADNFLEAIPILESLNKQSLFYILTRLLNTDTEIWWDQLEKIFFLNNNLPEELEIEIKGTIYNHTVKNESEIKSVYNLIHRHLKYSSLEEQKKIMNNLFHWSNVNKEGRESHRFLSFYELKNMAKSKSAIIGAHTDTHSPLVTLAYAEQYKDIKKSKDVLESIIGKKVEHFSYPFGLKKDYNKKSIKICKQLGFKMVCANYYSQIHQWTNRYELPRILIRDWDLKTFKSNLSTFFKY